MFGKKSGGTVQRETFGAKMGSRMASPEPAGKMKPEGKTEGGMGEIHGEGTTTINHADNSVDHADGEHSEHPSLAHAIMHIHGKHEGGEAMHVHNHGGHEASEGKPVTTHHHSHDGMVEGPHHHASMDEAAEHMKSAIGEGGNVGEDGANGAAMGGDGGIGSSPLDEY